jgi:hypothetical protein
LLSLTAGILAACGGGEKSNDRPSVRAGSAGMGAAGQPAGGASNGGEGASGGSGEAGEGSSLTGGKAAGGKAGHGGKTAQGGKPPTGGAGTGASIAGMAGKGGKPDPIPTDCADRPAVGTWEEITPPGAGPGASSVTVDALHPGVVFVGTVAAENVWGGPGNGLWKTSDCGETWSHINTGENADKLDPGSLVYILLSPTDSDLMYTNSLYGGLGLYRSTNGGVDWTDVTPMGEGLPDFVMGEAVDPEDGRHLLMTFHDNCSGPHAPLCIGETFDGGDTWRIFNGPADVNGWAEQAGLFFLDTNRWLFGAPSKGLYYTEDSGGTWESVLGYPGCHGFGKLIKLEDKYYLPCWGGIAESPNGKNWQLIMGSPRAISLELAGDTLFASFVIDDTGQPFWSAPLADTKTWTNVDTGHQFPNGAFHLAYDSHHRILYAASFGGGLWRVAME